MPKEQDFRKRDSVHMKYWIKISNAFIIYDVYL